MPITVSVEDTGGHKLDDPAFDGFISAICIAGKTYKLRCEVVEVYPMICPRCGGRVELHYGSGNCQSCGTGFTTQFKIVEK